MRPCRFDLQSTVVSSKYLIDFCDEFQFSPRYWRIKVRILMIKCSEGRSIHYRMAQRRIGKTATIVLLALLVMIGFSKAADQDGSCIQAVAIGAETDMYKEALTASLIKELQRETCKIASLPLEFIQLTISMQCRSSSASRKARRSTSIRSRPSLVTK